MNEHQVYIVMDTLKRRTEITDARAKEIQNVLSKVTVIEPRSEDPGVDVTDEEATVEEVINAEASLDEGA